MAITIKRFTELLEDNDMRFQIIERNGGILCAEIEFTSKAGEDVIEALYFTPETIVDDFYRLSREFDADEHAATYVNSRGQNGIPDSIRELIDDADWIKYKLMGVADEIYKHEVT